MRARGHFLVRTEREGRERFQAVANLRQAMELAQVHSGPSAQIAVLDATGRVVWKSAQRTAG
jgi:hypothetical protein